jgi:excisionase family DNA binding protein
LRDGFKIDIEYLQVEAAKQSQSNVPAEKIQVIPQKGSTLSDTDDSTASETSEENMTLKEVAKCLRKSTRTIYKWAESGEIPCYKPAGNTYLFIRSEIDTWKRSNKLKRQKPATPEINLENQATEKPTYIFKVPPELFTNVFVKHGYLTKPNAEKMADRFKAIPKGNDGSPIEWEKKLKSLLTFILVLEQFELIETDESNRKLLPSLAINGKEDLIILAPFVLDNFIIKAGGKSAASISRARINIINTLGDMREKAKTASKNDNITVKAAVKYFRTKKGAITVAKKFKNGIDWTMLKIVNDMTEQRISS